MALAEYDPVLRRGEQEEGDPSLLKGDELFDYMHRNEFTCIVSSDQFGVEFLDDIDNRLGEHRDKVDVRFESHPGNPDNLVVHFAVRETTTAFD